MSELRIKDKFRHSGNSRKELDTLRKRNSEQAERIEEMEAEVHALQVRLDVLREESPVHKLRRQQGENGRLLAKSLGMEERAERAEAEVANLKRSLQGYRDAAADAIRREQEERRRAEGAEAEAVDLRERLHESETQRKAGNCGGPYDPILEGEQPKYRCTSCGAPRPAGSVDCSACDAPSSQWELVQPGQPASETWSGICKSCGTGYCLDSKPAGQCWCCGGEFSELQDQPAGEMGEGNELALASEGHYSDRGSHAVVLDHVLNHLDEEQGKRMANTHNGKTQQARIVALERRVKALEDAC
jgi:hypothetical protein